MSTNTELTEQALNALELNGQSLDVSDLSKDNPFIQDMSEEQIAAGFALYVTGCASAAAKLLHRKKTDITRVSRCTSVRRLIKALIRSDLDTTGIKSAFDALQSVVNDDGESATARTRAAEMLLKWSGEIGKEQEKDREKDLSNMTIGELESVITKLEAQKAELSKDVIEYSHNPDNPN